MATVIDYFSLLVTACHRLFTYHCLAPVLSGKKRALSRTIRWKERATSRSRKHVFHPDEFLRSRVTGQSTSRSACMRLSFLSPTYVHTHTHTHTHTPTVSSCWYLKGTATVYKSHVPRRCLSSQGTSMYPRVHEGCWATACGFW